MQAIVLFHGEAVDEVTFQTHPLSFLLKPGFKHCSVCVETDGIWIHLDGKMGVPKVTYLTTSDDFDLAEYYRDKGYTVFETEQRAVPLLSPLVINNCVGLVKATLCISAPFVWSPWRLYRHLTKENR